MSSGNSIQPGSGSGAAMQFASVTQSDGTRTMDGAPVFLPENQIYVEFVPGRSTPSLGQENTKGRAPPTGYRTV